MHISEIDRELRSKRSRHELGEGQAFLVIRLRDPFPLLDEIPVHVTHERDRASEADGPELRHVLNHLPQRIVWGARR